MTIAVQQPENFDLNWLFLCNALRFQPQKCKRQRSPPRSASELLASFLTTASQPFWPSVVDTLTLTGAIKRRMFPYRDNDGKGLGCQAPLGSQGEELFRAVLASPCYCVLRSTRGNIGNFKALLVSICFERFEFVQW